MVNSTPYCGRANKKGHLLCADLRKHFQQRRPVGGSGRVSGGKEEVIACFLLLLFNIFVVVRFRERLQMILFSLLDKGRSMLKKDDLIGDLIH